jgi:hypothetical protein
MWNQLAELGLNDAGANAPSGQTLEDLGQFSRTADAVPGAGEQLPIPPFLRGKVAALARLKLYLSERIVPVVDAYKQIHGFQSGATGAAACAADGLCADLTGGGGPLPTPEQAIAALHRHVFNNYNQWAHMVGATPVVHMGEPAGPVSPPGSVASSTGTGNSPASVASTDAASPDRTAPGSVGHHDHGGSSGSLHNAANQPPAETDAATRPDDAGETGGTDAAATDRTDGTADQPAGVGGTAEPAGDGRTQAERTQSGEATVVDVADVDPLTISLSPEAQQCLEDLCLFYCIRAEAANLRFMPE